MPLRSAGSVLLYLHDLSDVKHFLSVIYADDRLINVRMLCFFNLRLIL